MSDQDRMNNVLDKGYIKTLGCKNNTNNRTKEHAHEYHDDAVSTKTVEQ
jgi:hypothetical protein